MLQAMLLVCMSGYALLAMGQETFSLNAALAHTTAVPPVQSDLSKILDSEIATATPSAETGLTKVLDGELVMTTKDPLAVIVPTTEATTRRPSFASVMSRVDWSQASNLIVGGIIESFFQKANLLPQEKQCLERNVGNFVGDVTGVVTDAVNALRPFFGSESGSHQLSSTSSSELMIDGVTKITNLITVTSTLMRSCVEGDGLLVLNQTAKHLMNFKYLGKRFVVNGIDIAEALAEAIVSFEKQQWLQFGEHIGFAMRKVLLSTSTKGISLPEGYATDEIITECSQGIASGFFARGSKMIVKDLADSNVDIEVDLHQCIVENHDIYADIFKSFWILIAQLAANKNQHQLGGSAFSFKNGEAPAWVDELIFAFMRIPGALTRCNMFNSDTQDMFTEAFKTLRSVRFDFQFPDDKIQADKATEKVALAVEHFARHQYFAFGQELGKLFRELLLLAFPQKYSVDSSGLLQRNLASDVAGFNAKLQETRFGVPVLFAGGVAFAILVSLVAFKSFRTVAGWRQAREYVDVEAGEDDDDVKTLE